MKKWRLLLKDMGDAGGVDLWVTRLPGWCRDYETAHARDSLIEKGLICRGKGCKHSLTRAGWLIYRGVADMVPRKGKPRTGTPMYEMRLAIGSTVSDLVIQHLMAQVGLEPDKVPMPALREFSNRLVIEARATAKSQRNFLPY